MFHHSEKWFGYVSPLCALRNEYPFSPFSFPSFLDSFQIQGFRIFGPHVFQKSSRFLDLSPSDACKLFGIARKCMELIMGCSECNGVVTRAQVGYDSPCHQAHIHCSSDIDFAPWLHHAVALSGSIKSQAMKVKGGCLNNVLWLEIPQDLLS